jgi:SAM-dependent methyltransferase
MAGGDHARFLAGGGHELRPRLARALALADLEPGQTVVDLGCGRGEAAAHAAQTGAAVIALDYSLDALKLSRATHAVVAAGAPRTIVLAAADATALPLADGCADRVLVLDVVEHLWPWQLAATLAEVGRILRPGGFVVIHTLPNRWALRLAYPVLRAVSPAAALPASPRSDYERAVHVNEQSPWSLKRALTAAGFASRVWVEEWSTVQAGRQVRTERRPSGRQALERSEAVERYPDPQRSRGYPVLRRPVVRRVAAGAMRTPLRWCVGNDIFAVAWTDRGHIVSRNR